MSRAGRAILANAVFKFRTALYKNGAAELINDNLPDRAIPNLVGDTAPLYSMSSCMRALHLKLQ